MMTARSASFAYLAIILTVAALVFPKNAWAASGNMQICHPSTSCTVGEFLFNDSYAPITSGATCTITSRYPNGTLFLNAQSLVASAEGDGWYAYTFTVPATTGIYRTEIKCTVGTDVLALDKSFEVQAALSTLTTSDVAGAVWNANKSSYTASGTFGEVLQNIVPSANDIAGSVWDYSGRTLTDFGTLVADIWASATNSNNVTKVTNINNVTNQIQNTLEQLVNKPIIDNSIDSSTTTNLQSKIDDTKKQISQTDTNLQYIKSKIALINAKWSSLTGDDKSRMIAQSGSVLDSVSSDISDIEKGWGWSEATRFISQVRLLQQNLDSAKSAPSKALIASISQSVARLQSLNSKLEQKMLDAQVLSDAMDSKSSQLQSILLTYNKDNAQDSKNKINSLSTDVASLNKLPEADSIILAKLDQTSTDLQAKNKALALEGIIGANKSFLAQTYGNTLSNTWLELGSIIFKTLVTNPSSLISQKVPVKYYLPQEVTKESIIKIDDGLSITYDPEKSEYYVSGEYTLAPDATKTVLVEVDDKVFKISSDKITSLRNQADELSKPLNNTAYFAQGVTLKSDIDASCDKITELMQDGVTPDAKIKAFRDAMIEYHSASAELDRLKELSAQAGSVGTLFGFVGGAQALAVWGLIIIMTAGFVFLALYMRALRSGEKYLREESIPVDDRFENYEEDPSQRESAADKTSKKRLPFYKAYKYLAVLILSVLIGGSGIYGFGALRQSKQTGVALKISSQTNSKPAPSVLGTSAVNKPGGATTHQEVQLFVPDNSLVSIMAEPSLQSQVLSALNAPINVEEENRKDGWVKIALNDKNGKTIEGWVDQDFIDAEQKAPAVVPETQQKVTVTDTPTGFLRVRKTPGGDEITELNPGEQFSALGEQSGWVQIVLEDGTSGWVSKQYVTFNSAPFSNRY